LSKRMKPYSHRDSGEGRRAKKALGQHFLVDQNIARKIVGQLDPAPGDKVLEIGPGQGALTLWLSKAEARVLALEKDFDLARKVGGLPGVTAVNADALDFAWERLYGRGTWKIAGNLPYNVASPLMWDIAARACFERAVFMVQKEVAQRAAANPGGRTYGGLSVWLQSFVRPEIRFYVGPNVFRPRPRVDSAVLFFHPRDRAKLGFDPRALAALIKLFFQNRRKQTGVILKKFWSKDMEKWYDSNGLDGRQRPETFTPEQFQSLSGLLKNRLIS